MAPISYVLPEEMHEFERDGRYLFLDPVNFVWFQTDFIGKVVVAGLAKGRSAEETAAEVGLLAGVPLSEAVAYTHQFYTQLFQIGFLHEEKYAQKVWSKGLAERPTVIYLHMTGRCNLKCPYCYNQEHRFQLRRTAIANLERFQRLIDEAVTLSFRGLKLTGGEPLLNPDTLRIARYARERKLWINLLTNGTLIDERNAPVIAETVDAVSISLDSPIPEEHDAVRGRNTFLKVMRGIRLLRMHGLRHLHVNAVITPVNRASVEAFLAYAWDELKSQKVSVATAGIEAGDPLGRWGAARYALTPAEVEDVYEQEARFYEKRSSTPPVISSASLRRTQCGAGNGIVSIDFNGDLYPCQTMHLPEFLCGNVFESSLKEVLESSGLLRDVKNLVVDQIEGCATCAMRYICAGGCRMHAYSREGRLTARDPLLCENSFRRALDKLWNSANLPVAQATGAEAGPAAQELC